MACQKEYQRWLISFNCCDTSSETAASVMTKDTHSWLMTKDDTLSQTSIKVLRQQSSTRIKGFTGQRQSSDNEVTIPHRTDYRLRNELLPPAYFLNTPDSICDHFQPCSDSINDERNINIPSLETPTESDCDMITRIGALCDKLMNAMKIDMKEELLGEFKSSLSAVCSQSGSPSSSDNSFDASELRIRPIASSEKVHTNLTNSSHNLACAIPQPAVPTSTANPSSFSRLPEYDGSGDVTSFQAQFLDYSLQHRWLETEEIFWLKEVCLSGAIKTSVSKCQTNSIKDLWNILFWHKHQSVTPSSHRKPGKRLACKNCCGDHPPYACKPCQFCDGFHYHNRCPHKVPSFYGNTNVI